MSALAATAPGLPLIAFAVDPETRACVMIRRGDGTLYGTGCRRPESAALNNQLRGISPAQAAAMLGGALHGWDAPEADPAHYDEAGHYLKGRNNNGTE